MTDAQVSTAPALTTSTSTGGIVLIGGAGSTALALVGVYFIGQTGENVMGWYADYVIPVGAALVGLVASSGFGIASWVSGTKISGRLLISVIALLAGSYFLAQYLEFRVSYPQGVLGENGTQLSFWGYFDVVTQLIAFEDHGKAGSALGLLGYGVRLLEVVGFVGGGVAIPAILRSKPFCEPCQRYKRTTDLAWLAASLPPKRISKKKTAELEARRAEEAAAQLQTEGGLKAILDAAAGGDPVTLTQTLATHGPRDRRSKVLKLPVRLVVSLVHCRRCFDGQLTVQQQTGQGRSIKNSLQSRTQLQSGLVAALASSK